ncbi:MAG: NOL1/NOP2/sun family putative RNA methylase [Calditrichaeota bacterium]|nr:MAG: NOL1/NOP2/sun family putative RNA methylase [Calditrichota bacterium]
MTFQVSSDLDKLFQELLGEEKQLLYQQIGTKLPHTFRFNPLKGNLQAQMELFAEQGFRFEPLNHLENIYRITYQPYPIGKSLSHFLGHIYVQDISSMIPALVLDPRPGEWILDMSAAPGSKTTLMGSLMNNRGVLLANDIVPKRLRALGNNIDRWGLCNVVVQRWYGEQFGNVYFETFDRILLDPACSGLGTLHKNPEVLGWWSPEHCIRLAASQRNLLTSALKALRPGGVVVYSTCTLTPEENEAVIDFALKEFPVEVEAIEVKGISTRPGLTRFGDREFHPDLTHSIRLYPINSLTEGFFIARLRKTGEMKPPKPEKRKPPRHLNFITARKSPVKKYLDYLSQHFAIPAEVFRNWRYLMQKSIIFCSPEMDSFPFYGAPMQLGLTLATPMTHGAKFNTAGSHIIGQHAQKNVIELTDLEVLEKFVNREPLDIGVDSTGQMIVKYKGLVIGYGVADKGKLKSQFPKGEWPFYLTRSVNELDDPAQNIEQLDD